MLKKIKQELKAGRVLLQFGFLRALGQGLGMIAPLVIAKFFTEGLFGSYCLAKMIIFFFAALLVASAQTPFIVYANQERTQTGRISKSFSVQFGFLAFSIIVFVLFSLAFSRRIQIFAEVSSADVLFMGMGFVGIATKSFLCNLFKPGDGIGRLYEGPLLAVEQFLSENSNFVVDKERERYILTYNPRGFLKRIK